MKIMTKIVWFLSVVTAAVLLTGCGRKDENLQKYYDEMDAFITQANMDFAALSEVDPLSESAVPDMLDCIDELAQTFETLAAIAVPDNFSAIESLADDASRYMTEAADLYHQAYSTEPLSMNYYEAATENYARAVRRMEFISDLLQGQIPDDASVTVTEEIDGPGFYEDQEEITE